MATVTVPDGPYIQHYRTVVGDTLTSTITFSEGAPPALADVTDDEFRMVVAYQDTGALVHELEIGSGIAFEGDSKIRWTLTAAQTADFEPLRPMTYSIVRTRADGVVRTIQAGSITPQKF